MRKKIVAGNWKMNKTPSEAVELVNMLKPLCANEDVDVVFCVPAIDIIPAMEAAKGSNIAIGAENMYYEESGAYTGEISPAMLVDAGVKYVVLGHSERREILGESDEFIARKVKCALDHDITPILCVGETKDEHDAGKTEEKIETQVRAALEKIPTDKVSNVVIAYEPIWAIGSGAAATADEAEAVAKLIRQIVKNIAGKKVSDQVRILYGGSVNAGNINDFTGEKDIDGALVGGASLKPEEFISIYQKA